MNIQDFFIPVAHAQSTSPVVVLGLNWELFIAQLINFAIVLFILWKWVFTPVAKKLQERTDKIEKAMRDANSITKEKTEFEQWKNEEMKKARQEASTIVTAAQKDATAAKDQILQKSKEEQQKLVDQAKKQIEQEKNQQLQSAKSELADLVTNATEKILRSKLDGKKDGELIKNSLQSIQ